MSKKLTYQELREEVEKPQSEREQHKIGRQGKNVTPRKLHLTKDEIKKLETQRKATGGIINPYGLRKRTGLYYAQVQSLIELGENIWHHCSSVNSTINEIMQGVKKINKVGQEITAWDQACARSSQRSNITSENKKTIEGKIEQNFKVLQRIGANDRYPYGEKLRQLNMCIDIDYRLPEGIEDTSLATPYYRLNTNFVNIEDVIPSYNNPYVKRGRRIGSKNKKTIINPCAEKELPTQINQVQTDFDITSKCVTDYKLDEELYEE
jgi:hypothetical protein